MDNLQLNTCSVQAMGKFLEWGRRPEMVEFFRHFPPYFEWSRDINFLSPIQNNSLEVVLGGNIIGIVHVGCVNPTAKSLMISILVDHPKHKEITDEVYKKIAHYVFVEKDFDRIELKILRHRTKLRKRLEALGFKTEGLLRRSCRVAGEAQDEVMLGVLKGEAKWRS